MSEDLGTVDEVAQMSTKGEKIVAAREEEEATSRGGHLDAMMAGKKKPRQVSLIPFEVCMGLKYHPRYEINSYACRELFAKSSSCQLLL